MTNWHNPAVWRHRLVLVRGLLVTALALLFLLAEAHAALPIPALLVVFWLAALLLPSLLFLVSRRVGSQRQGILLAVELVLDQVLFLALLHQLGGSTNPLAYYLLVPVMLSAMAQPLPLSSFQTALAIAGYGLTLHWHIMPGSDTHLHALTHQMHHSHGFGMWLAFSLIALALTWLGQLLRNAQRNERQRQASALNLALQRERMYDVAGSLADRAHELNTPISSLLLFTEELEQADNLPTELRPSILQVQQLARQISDLLRPETQPADASPQTLSSICSTLNRTLRHLSPGIRVHWEGPDDPLLPQPAAWRRVLANLGYNACDAGASSMHVRCSRSSDGWLLQVSDDGPRGNSEYRREGMGIGLALVETTLAALGASLELEFHHQWTQARIQIPRGQGQ